MLEMVKEAEKELLNYPERNMGYYLKRFIKIITGYKQEPLDKINWPNGLLAKSLIDYYMQNRNSEEAAIIIKCLRKYYDRWIKRGCKINYLDDMCSGMALIDLHQITGDEKYKKAAETMVQYLFHHEMDPAGSLPYRPEQKNDFIFADGIGMVCPFLCKYGSTYGDINAINLATVQIQNFIDGGMDGKTGLPYHGYQFENGVKYGIIGWGRAVGWLMIGMSESLAYMDETMPGYDIVRQSYRRMVDKVEAYQLENGLYSWQLAAREGPVDTSATAMILYAIARSLETKDLIGIHKSRMQRGREALWNMVKEGKLYDCLAECQGFSMYPQVYDAYPWSLGPALSLFAMDNEWGKNNK
ncbi:glycoside hydrolase family 88 protein [Parablautia intestinalis]|uniref:glycoside hydrolase family 88 protein n=1 Tax=Parablautia intestinalis TaxID=2320100 RepID=UPI00256EACE9|nr:glycoside hydrolase family 88 protein [Parablautia intestinalis]